MPYHFELDRKHQILRACIEGSIGDDEATRFRAETAKLLGDLRPKACIVDLSATKQYDISSATVGSIARSAPALSSISISVIVVAPALICSAQHGCFKSSAMKSVPGFVS